MRAKTQSVGDYEPELKPTKNPKHRSANNKENKTLILSGCHHKYHRRWLASLIIQWLKHFFQL